MILFGAYVLRSKNNKWHLKNGRHHTQVLTEIWYYNTFCHLGDLCYDRSIRLNLYCYKKKFACVLRRMQLEGLGL